MRRFHRRANDIKHRTKTITLSCSELRHGHGVGSKYRSEEERLNDSDVEYEGERQVAAFEQSFERKMR